MARLDESTALTDTVAQHLADHNKLHAKANYIFDVMDYGATGDGSTDDTTAIQSAIDAAVADGGGTVYFPHPTSSYRVTDTLTIGGKITLQGENQNDTIISSAHNNTVVAQSTPGTRIYGVVIKDLYFYRSSGTSSIVIDWDSISLGRMERVTIGNYTSSTALKLSSSVSGGCVMNYFAALNIIAGTCLLIAGSASNENSFHGCRLSGYSTTGTGVYITGGSNNSFYGCNLENGAYGIRIDDTTGIQNSFYSPRLEACTTAIHIENGRSNQIINPYFSANTTKYSSNASYSNLVFGASTPNTTTDSTLYINEGVGIFTGTGSPESSVTAVVGSLFIRTDGGAGTTLYVKESGTGNTGWAGV